MRTRRRSSEYSVIVDRVYSDALNNIDGIGFMPELEGTFSSRWLTALTLDPKKIEITPYELIHSLANENIESRPICKPLHLQPVFEG